MLMLYLDGYTHNIYRKDENIQHTIINNNYMKKTL